MNGEAVRRPITRILACFVILMASGACSEGLPELETRTFEVVHLEDWVVERLIEPYVYAVRPGAPGTMSVVDGKLTVRETADNLARIEDALRRYDVPTPLVRLSFQIIEANGEEEVDPRIEHVEAALRQLFRFQGYRLIGEVMVFGTEGNQVHQEFDVAGLGPSAIEAIIRDVRVDSAGTSVQVEMQFHAGARTVFGTTVRVRAGQTAVLGRSPSSISSRNIILALRPEIEDLD